jgi:hypothetical protein
MFKIIFKYQDEPRKKWSIILDAPDIDKAISMFVDCKPLADIVLVEQLDGRRDS